MRTTVLALTASEDAHYCRCRAHRRVEAGCTNCRVRLRFECSGCLPGRSWMEVRRRRKPCGEALRTVPFPVAASWPRGPYADAGVFFAGGCQIKWNSSRGTACHPTYCRACAQYLRHAAFVRGGAGVRIYLQEEPRHGRA